MLQLLSRASTRLRQLATAAATRPAAAAAAASAAAAAGKIQPPRIHCKMREKKTTRTAATNRTGRWKYYGSILNPRTLPCSDNNDCNHQKTPPTDNHPLPHHPPYILNNNNNHISEAGSGQ
eukprot:TRINITY_DN110582_c0_g1_i1.p1 TRINITY_DN110582_c0_g1~~TRINITY_DN110582_c0_g1_i1.p1  ORF type:complete len:121 (+),score=30.58 TRINITY_DN110582_c0_g1_i1:32-394(+)